MSDILKKERTLDEDLQAEMLEEVLDTIMPMIEKQLPNAEAALKASLDGSDGKGEKIAIIRTTSTGVAAIVFNKEDVTVSLKEGKEPVNVISSQELIKGLISGGFKKM